MQEDKVQPEKCTSSEKRQTINDLDVSVNATDVSWILKRQFLSSSLQLRRNYAICLSGSKKQRRFQRIGSPEECD